MKLFSKIISGAFLLTLSFVVWHFSLAQSGVGVEGYVPQTDLNKNVISDQEIKLNQPQPITKENKYLYFFEKFLTEKELADEHGQIINHSKYDLFFSFFFMVVILLILAILTILLLRFIDKWLFNFRKKYAHKAQL